MATPEKELNVWVKQGLELGPPILFFLIYLRIRDNSYTIAGVEYSGFIVATLIFVPILLAAMAILWKLTGKLSRMQIFTAIMVIFFGGLTAWFNDEEVAAEVYNLFEEHNITNIITDTAGRRDLLHMRLTSPSVFVRYVGANHESDYSRLDDWMIRIKSWVDMGMQNLYFFVHQNLEKESPVMSAYLIEKLNKELSLDLTIPVGVDGGKDGKLF